MGVRVTVPFVSSGVRLATSAPKFAPSHQSCTRYSAGLGPPVELFAVGHPSGKVALLVSTAMSQAITTFPNRLGWAGRLAPRSRVKWKSAVLWTVRPVYADQGGSPSAVVVDAA